MQYTYIYIYTVYIFFSTKDEAILRCLHAKRYLHRTKSKAGKSEDFIAPQNPARSMAPEIRPHNQSSIRIRIRVEWSTHRWGHFKNWTVEHSVKCRIHRCRVGEVHDGTCNRQTKSWRESLCLRRFPLAILRGTTQNCKWTTEHRLLLDVHLQSAKPHREEDRWLQRRLAKIALAEANQLTPGMPEHSLHEGACPNSKPPCARVAPPWMLKRSAPSGDEGQDHIPHCQKEKNVSRPHLTQLLEVQGDTPPRKLPITQRSRLARGRWCRKTTGIGIGLARRWRLYICIYNWVVFDSLPMKCFVAEATRAGRKISRITAESWWKVDGKLWGKQDDASTKISDFSMVKQETMRLITLWSFDILVGIVGMEVLPCLFCFVFFLYFPRYWPWSGQMFVRSFLWLEDDWILERFPL